MKLILILTLILTFGILNVSQAETSGEVSFSFYPDKNEFDHAGNTEPYTARYELEGEFEYKHSTGLFLGGEGQFYFGSVYPGQNGNGNESYRFTPLVADVSGEAGYYITDYWSVSVESGRTLDMGRFYAGDKFKYNKIKTTLKF